MDKLIYYLKKYSDKSSLVLDAGSGQFRWTKYLSESNNDVLCIDITRPSLDNLSRYNFIQASIESLPFSGNNFDFIYSISVVQLMKNEEIAMGEFYRVLKPGGKLLLTVPTALSPFRFLRDFEIRFGVYHYYHLTDVYHYYTRNRIKKLLTNRFEIMDLYGYLYNFMPRCIDFIIYSTRINKIFHLLRSSYFIKVITNRMSKEIKDERQVNNSEDQNQTIQHEKEIIKHKNVAKRRFCFLSDFSYHYIIVLQKNL